MVKHILSDNLVIHEIENSFKDEENLGKSTNLPKPGPKSQVRRQTFKSLCRITNNTDNKIIMNCTLALCISIFSTSFVNCHILVLILFFCTLDLSKRWNSSAGLLIRQIVFISWCLWNISLIAVMWTELWHYSFIAWITASFF